MNNDESDEKDGRLLVFFICGRKIFIWMLDFWYKI